MKVTSEMISDRGGTCRWGVPASEVRGEHANELQSNGRCQAAGNGRFVLV